MADPEHESAGADAGAGAIRTQCCTCRGEGVLVVARMAAINGRFGSAPEVRRCRDCEGDGWLPGSVPPA